MIQINQGQPQNEQPTLNQMLDVANSHNSIVYTINYSGYISSSSILGAPNGRVLGEFNFSQHLQAGLFMVKRVSSIVIDSPPFQSRVSNKHD